jgi:hypothetical protein
MNPDAGGDGTARKDRAQAGLMSVLGPAPGTANQRSLDLGQPHYPGPGGLR